MKQSDTISAIATAAGEAGIGIVRISGAAAIAAAERLFRPANGRRLGEAESHRALYGQVVDADGAPVDEALALVMRAPHSYTREDVVEIQCHGGRTALRRILRLSYLAGARPAEPGEFTKRAFLNGRLDLSQAQAVMDIIQAKTDASLKMAAGHLSGSLSEKVGTLRHGILAMIAHLEAAIDFPEDDIDEAAIDEVRGKVVEQINHIQKLLATAHAGKILREGLMTAIIGKPNVGKSSLLNALLGEERAIVTDIPGTTRDSIEEYADIGGVPLCIIDTAGIRATEDAVEKIGVEKARAYVERASLILALFDGSRPLDAEDEEILSLVAGRTAILLVNKCDLAPAFAAETLAERLPGAHLCRLAAKAGTGLEQLAGIIRDIAYGGEAAGGEAAFVCQERQANLLREAEEHMRAALSTIDYGMSADFIVIDLRSAWEKLGEITGETVGEDIIDEIFSKFCIGK